MTCASTQTDGNTSANLEIAGCRFLTRTTRCWKCWAGQGRGRESSAIPGVLRWIRTEIFTFATREITGCKSSFGDEFPVPASAISLAGRAGDGVGDLAVAQKRCADQLMAAVGSVDAADCRGAG